MAIEITWAGIITGSIVAVGSAYLARRGQNLADRHDLESVTRAIENMRSEFRVAEEHSRNLLAKDTGTHLKRFEVELPIYQLLWNKVVDLDYALTDVTVAAGAGITTEGRSANQAYATFRERLAILQETVRRLEPFFASEISKAITIATIPLRMIAAQTSMTAFPSGAEERNAKFTAEAKAVGDALIGLKEAIRSRLLADSIAVAKSIQTRDEKPAASMVVRTDA